MRPDPAKTKTAKVRKDASSLARRRERQIVRILALLRILAQGRTPSVHELAAEFHTRRETIYRDLRVLQDAGYPVAGDEQGRLSRPRLLRSPVPEIRFSAPELEALRAAIKQAQVALPNRKLLASAAMKLKAMADSPSDGEYGRMDEVFETWSSGVKDYSNHEEHIAVLVEAILRKVRCVVEYRKPAAPKPKTFDFDPYRLLLVGGGIYVLGHVPKHAGIITLAVERLLSVVLLGIEYQPAPTFDMQKYRTDAFGVAWDNPADIVLGFRADQAPYVRERTWHPSQNLTDLTGGGVQLALRAGGSFEIRRWILGWGDAVQVVSPEALRDDISQMLHSAVRLYKTDAAPARDV